MRNVRTGAGEFEIPVVIFAVGLTLFAATALVVSLSMAMRPSDRGKRVTLVEEQYATAYGAQKLVKASLQFGPGSLCTAAEPAILQALKGELEQKAAALSISEVAVSLAPGEALMPSPTPVILKVTGVGPYGAVSNYLTALDQQRPKLFAEGFDMTSTPQGVQFKFSGRFYCRNAS